MDMELGVRLTASHPLKYHLFSDKARRRLCRRLPRAQSAHRGVESVVLFEPGGNLPGASQRAESKIDVAHGTTFDPKGALHQLGWWKPLVECLSHICRDFALAVSLD
eukprot:scaffold186351_cov28-Tisochrysis_lutea.AAC.2